ncbi:MAG: VCBS repeat-containing protein [Prolixibacteraceae bacterium]|jgi:enediyne biosynthesis protein E4|nr:VCBS repeat-containing protein [Prolixibacteraceae bacterium]MBT6764263.1 VCBS repeat-containing protein [Prolixibacteraceae bacterium]MBT7000178.1 VCBS repeat-containing protein [Prolixibacteraceae bacterium]MBT7396231.1 VCBS repeat-containing protein [Prolixibacteraceae bacterium]
MKFKKTYKFKNLFYIAVLLVLYRCDTSSSHSLFTSLNPSSIGIEFQNDIQETMHNNILRNEYTYNGGGVAAGDLNNDGLADVYFSGNMVSNKLYINKGNWKFEDVTKFSGTGGRKNWATGVVMVDINGDGWLDIYVCYSGNSPGEGYNLPVVRNLPGRANQLFINKGCEPGGVPTFTESAKKYGVDAIGTFSTQSYFFDYDKDGDLDMFLLNHANTFYAPFINTKRLRNLRHPYYGNKLFRNDNIKFVEVSKEAGIHGGGLNFGLSASISDINMDNWPDLYVTNDYDEQDYCYINNKDGTFREVSKDILGHMSKSSMGSDIADINNDGYADIFVLDMLPEDNHRQKLLRGQDSYDRYQLAVDSGFHNQYLRNILQLNRGLAADSLPRYSEIGQFAGISNTDWSWSVLLEDLDNDGLRDIFITTGYLRDITNMDHMTHTTEVYKKAAARKEKVNFLKLIEELPTTRLKNYVFQNANGIKFINKTDDWGFNQETISNGAAYADFDNDGDYDLITNNLNQHCTVLKNNQDEKLQNNFIKIKLIGSENNTQGIGAKIWIETEDKSIFHEAYTARGYLSSSEPVITLGLGNSELIKSLKVLWPDGLQTVLSNLTPNQLIKLVYSGSQGKLDSSSVEPNKTLLDDVTSTSGITFKHTTSNFVDFKKGGLWYYQLSKLGGFLATGDVNSDGNDDIFFGGAAGQSAELYHGNNDGTFSLSKNQPWSLDSSMEDMESLFFDADNDGDLDLYVVSGGVSFEINSAQYQDRLYLNDGTGEFINISNVLPSESTSGSCAVAADYDMDGDLDVFVGGRHQAMGYPISPKSFILRNESKGNNIKFVNATEEIGTSIEHIGMVTDAQWTDYNGDNWPDLIVVGEWMGIKVFQNVNGKLIEQKMASLEKSEGWWTSISQLDIDADGDMDYLVGNAGLNSQIKASVAEPIELYTFDYNNDGNLDPILCYYIQGKSYPMHSRNELLNHIIQLRKKFPNFFSYSDATIIDIIDPEMREKSFKLSANIMESCWIENVEGELILKKLPDLVQFSYVNSFINFDFDGDGTQDVIAAGNFYPLKPQIGMNDASMGTFLKFANNKLTVTDGIVSPLWLYGDIRDMALLSFKSGKKLVVVSKNNEAASIYAINPEFGKESKIR